MRILGGLIYLSLLRNSGAAFSLGSGYTWVFPLVTLRGDRLDRLDDPPAALGAVGDRARAWCSAARWATWATGCSGRPGCSRATWST